MNLDGAILTRSDTKSAIVWVSGEKFPSRRVKHIDVRVDFIRMLVCNSIVDVFMCPHNIANWMF